MKILAISLLAALMALVGPVGAQDVVHLEGGKTLAGKVTDGLLEVEVETPGGEVRVPWTRIERIDRAGHVRELYRERAGGLAAEDAPGHFLLALWCRRQGLAEEMEAELKAVLAVDPDHAGARSALGFEKVDERWVAGEGILTAKGFVRSGDRWVLEEEREWAEMAKLRDRELRGGEQKAGHLLQKAVDENPRVRKYAREALAGLPWSDTRVPLYRALGRSEPELRAFAATELGRIGEGEAVRPLLRTAVLDTSGDVREAAVAALRTFGHPEILLPLARALASERAVVRQHAAGAIGGLGDVRGVEYLVRRYSETWGPTQRNNLQVIRQVSYIQDFDVEIAQAAQIGDPIVGVLREGVILDFRMLGGHRKLDTVERRLIRSSLVRLTGEDQGDDPVAWTKWWAENRERLLAQTR